jgi:hypothetical protein
MASSKGSRVASFKQRGIMQIIIRKEGNNTEKVTE